MQPRFQGENLPHDLTLVELLRKVAEQKGLSVAQLAIAWVLSRGEDIVPLVGRGIRRWYWRLRFHWLGSVLRHGTPQRPGS